MSKDAPPPHHRELAAQAAAEEVLRTIYGDDLEGCAGSVDNIAGVIRVALDEQANRDDTLNGVHEKGLEAILLLSTPPADGPSLTPEALRSLLGDRLDKIRDLATKIMATCASVRALQEGQQASTSRAAE